MVICYFLHFLHFIIFLQLLIIKFSRTFTRSIYNARIFALIMTIDRRANTHTSYLCIHNHTSINKQIDTQKANNELTLISLVNWLLVTMCTVENSLTRSNSNLISTGCPFLVSFLQPTQPLPRSCGWNPSLKLSGPDLPSVRRPRPRRSSPSQDPS